MIKLLKKWWAQFLFQDKGIVPTEVFILTYIIVSLALVIGSFFAITWTLIIGWNICWIAFSLFDFLFLPKNSQLEFKRNLSKEMERMVSYEITISISNYSKKNVRFRLIDSIPNSFLQRFPMYGTLTSTSNINLTYKVIPLVRGNYSIDKLYVRYRSVLGLWEKQVTLSLKDSVRVIPDLTETKKQLASPQPLLMYEGTKIRKQQKGVGEFEKIRSYVVGDDPRMINWRQTAKLQEVMTNEYEPEHGKYITVLIDCGRMMGAELKQGNRLEKVLEAALTVSATALKKGDYVSIIAFAKNVKVFIPLAKGLKHLQTILHGIYNVKVEAEESNYAAAFQYLQSMQKKRSFLILFTDIHTFLIEESGLMYLQRLRRRHLFYMIGIEDETENEMVKQYPETVQLAMTKSLAQQQMLRKRREMKNWERQGLYMIEAPEEKLAIVAVSYYIDIMNRGLI